MWEGDHVHWGGRGGILGVGVSAGDEPRVGAMGLGVGLGAASLWFGCVYSPSWLAVIMFYFPSCSRSLQ